MVAAKANLARSTTPEEPSGFHQDYVSGRRPAGRHGRWIYILRTEEGANDIESMEDKEKYKKEIDEFNDRSKSLIGEMFHVKRLILILAYKEGIRNEHVEALLGIWVQTMTQGRWGDERLLGVAEVVK